MGEKKMTHKVNTMDDYDSALQGEGWASVDYTAMISQARTDEERRVLTEIRDEENQHQRELLELMRCKK